MSVDAPTQSECRTEMRRIVLSKTFQEAPKLIALLKHLVEGALGGQEIDEYSIGMAVFGKRENWVTQDEGVVRQNFSNLRHRLDQYYVNEGKEDSILILFPKRSGYLPRFEYNTHHCAATELARIMRWRDQTFPDLHQVSNLESALQLCVMQDRDYAPTYAAVAQLTLDYAFLGYRSFTPSFTISKVEEAVTTCLKLDSDLWQGHIANGALHCVKFQWDQAARAFERALQIAPIETRANIWYAAFLMAIGRTSEALELTIPPRRLELWLENRFTVLKASLFWHVGGHDDRAEHAMRMFHEINGGTSNHVNIEHLVLNDWPSEVLMTCIALRMDRMESAVRYADLASEHSRDGAFDGLRKLARARRACSYFSYPDEEYKPFYPPNDRRFSRALLHMAEEQYEEAITELDSACTEHDPLMIWLHLWPIFEPLHEHQSFRSLIERMNLPS